MQQEGSAQQDRQQAIVQDVAAEAVEQDDAGDVGEGGDAERDGRQVLRAKEEGQRRQMSV
jgi:hypothetical protein